MMNDLKNIGTLASRFTSDFDHFTNAKAYTEAETRLEFIDKLLVSLGWDVYNEQGLAHSRREVVVERTVQDSQRPDYTLRPNGAPTIYVEAKKPSVDIRTHLKSIFQARRYGYTDEHAIVVLTNFRTLSVYDARVPVDQDRDLPETALLARWDYTDYAENAEEITQYLGRDNVLTQDWSETTGAGAPVKYTPAGLAFLEHLRQWRLELGQSFIESQPSLDVESLNDLVQLLINRFLFIRMCEDRGLESKDTLKRAVASDPINLDSLFEKMNQRYNAGLFAPLPGNSDPFSTVPSAALRSVISRLYAPTSPFSFAVLDSDFLGRAYEQSLSENLELVGNDQGSTTVKLAKKADYERRDVVTTPQPLVDAVVEAALSRVPQKAQPARVLDFATGSGRFLIAAYQYLVSKEIQERLETGQLSRLHKLSDGHYVLPFEDKIAILRDSLFGIDIDFNAVEVARFSLLVAVLEDESGESLPSKTSLLPNMDDNIVHGNSLLRPDDSKPELVMSPTLAVDLDAIGFTNFDAVIGNPPYVATADMRKLTPLEFEEVLKKYKTPHQQWDKYFAFVEVGLKLLNEDGVLGVVIPNKWLTVVAAGPLRKLIRSDSYVSWLRNFTFHPVFEEKQIYVCGLVTQRRPSTELDYAEPESLETLDGVGSAGTQLPLAQWLPAEKSAAWVLPTSEKEKRVLTAIRKNSVPLGTIVQPRNGLQTSANDVFLVRDASISNGYATFTAKAKGAKESTQWKIESDLLVPYLDDSTQVSSFRPVVGDAHLIFPYRADAGRLSGRSLIPEEELRSSHPLTYAYLLSHKERLLKRDKGAHTQMKDGGGFYAYGRGQALGYATSHPKIFYTVNQRGDKYGLDESGIAFQSGGTGGEVALFPIDSNYSLDFVLGLLDQPEIELYLRKRGSPFRGGYFARGTDVISTVPVPDLDMDDPGQREFHDKVVALVRQIRELKSRQVRSLSLRTDVHERQIQQARKNLRSQFLEWWKLT